MTATSPTKADCQTTKGEDSKMTINQVDLRGNATLGAQAANNTNPLLASISPISAGLTIVGITEPTLTPHVRNSFTKLALNGGCDLGLPFPSGLPVTSVFAGSPRRIEQAKVLAAASATGAMTSGPDYRLIDVRDGFDWSSDAGLLSLIPIIESVGGWVTIEQRVNSAVTSAMAEGLLRVRQTAQGRGIRVMLFLICPMGLAASGAHELSNEAIEIVPCEPDPMFDSAFSIDCVGLQNLHGLGIGKVMCSVHLSEGAIRYVYQPFVSADLESRFIWALRAQGKSLAEIGTLLKRNKTTVLRRLRGLPATRDAKAARAWLDKNVEWMALNDSQDDPSDDPSSADDASRILAKS
jgi:hypothetical protein